MGEWTTSADEHTVSAILLDAPAAPRSNCCRGGVVRATELGYDVHITRRDDWSDESGPAISRAEWFHLISRDPSLRLARQVVVENEQGQPISLQADTLTVWLDWPKRDEGRAESLLWHSGGNVYAKNPDTETLRKMYVIASAFEARVQGDDGELYDASGTATEQQRRRWWRFW